MVSVKFEDNSAEVINLMIQASEKALEAIGMQAETYGKKLCPVDTGRLRNSITHQTESDAVYVGTAVEYAPFVELGTSRQKAQPYIKPAVADHADEYKRIAKAMMENG